MGTNYYLVEEECQRRGRGSNNRHIGKSSAGWVFALHVYPEDGINDLEDYILAFDQGDIRDEYGAEISCVVMLGVIMNRHGLGFTKTPSGYADWADFHAKNHSYPGPEGLLRWQDATPGAGTWDCMTGDFS